jgi:MFS family permease
MMILFSPVFGFFSDRTKRKKPFVLLSAMLFTVVLILIGFATNELLILSVISLGIIASSFSPVLITLPPSLLGPESAVSGFCILSICGSIGVAVISPLIGLIIDASQSMVLAYVGLAAFSAIAVLFSYMLKCR